MRTQHAKIRAQTRGESFTCAKQAIHSLSHAYTYCRCGPRGTGPKSHLNVSYPPRTLLLEKIAEIPQRHEDFKHLLSSRQVIVAGTIDDDDGPKYEKWYFLPASMLPKKELKDALNGIFKQLYTDALTETEYSMPGSLRDIYFPDW